LLRKANVLITGLPGCGKSTLVTRVVDNLRAQGIQVGGISTPEFRGAGGLRGGFLIRDIATGAEQIMAAVDLPSHIQVGRYGVDGEAIRAIGVSAINQAVVAADIVIIDEIGKMELAVPEFANSVVAAFDSAKPVLGTIGLYLTSPLAAAVKKRPDVTVLTLRRGDQEAVYRRVLDLLALTGVQETEG
jgi:nucleoside-triphosphatase